MLAAERCDFAAVPVAAMEQLVLANVDGADDPARGGARRLVRRALTTLAEDGLVRLDDSQLPLTARCTSVRAMLLLSRWDVLRHKGGVKKLC